MDEHVTIVEVGPRDGLQNEARIIPANEKIALVDMLSFAGFKRIEVTSFVRPDRVPQMADASEVLAGISRHPGTEYTALTPNIVGYRMAVLAHADGVAIFAAASESFSKANLNCGIEESLERFRIVATAAHEDGVPLRGYISTVTHCPFEGKVAPSAVARVAARLTALGCHEISLGETLGRARPEEVDAMLQAVLQEVPPQALAGHFHDTGGRALANIDVSLSRGLRVFDASIGGLGGCPYAPGAPGNVDTLTVADHLSARGYVTGLDRQALVEAARFAAIVAGRE